MTSSLGSLIGAARPRVDLRPDTARWSYGPEACELAALAGIEPEPWQAEALDVILGVRDDGKWAAREYAEIVGRQQGKSIGIGLPRCTFGMIVLRERLTIWSAHQYKTSLEAFLQARDALYRLGEEAGQNLIGLEYGDELLLVKVNNTNGEEGFELTVDGELSPAARWRFVARSAGSGRGFSGDNNVVDEAFAYTVLQRRALAPTLLARPNPQSLYLSSPPLTGATGDVLFALAVRAARRAKNLGYRDWGLSLLLDDLERMPAPERAAFLDDRRNWAMALPALNRGRVTEESIAQLREEFEGDDLGFATEVLCMWPRQATSTTGWIVIPQDTWTARGGAQGRPTERLAFAIDATWPDARMGAIGVAGGAAHEMLVAISGRGEQLDHRPGTGWIVARAVELHRQWPHAAWVLDSRGPAGHLKRELEDAGITLVLPGPTDVAQAYGRFLAAATQTPATLRHYNQEALDDAVRDADTRDLGDGRTWARKKTDATSDLSPLTAVTLALGEAARRDPPKPSPPAAVPAAQGPGVANLQTMGF